jgi:hypothetical protein
MSFLVSARPSQKINASAAACPALLLGPPQVRFNGAMFLSPSLRFLKHPTGDIRMSRSLARAKSTLMAIHGVLPGVDRDISGCVFIISQPRVNRNARRHFSMDALCLAKQMLTFSHASFRHQNPLCSMLMRSHPCFNQEYTSTSLHDSPRPSAPSNPSKLLKGRSQRAHVSQNLRAKMQ